MGSGSFNNLGVKNPNAFRAQVGQLEERPELNGPEAGGGHQSPRRELSCGNQVQCSQVFQLLKKGQKVRYLCKISTSAF